MMTSAYINYDKKSVVRVLLRFNMQWYAKVMGDILLRYKILLLFLVCILATTLTSIFNFVILPVKGFLSYPVASFVGLVASFLLFQLFALIWIKLHQLVLLKQPWKNYFLTLQISNVQKLMIDICMLLIIDILLWFPFIFSITESLFSSGIERVEFYLILCKSILTIMLILLIQLSWIKNKYKLLVSVLLIDLILIFCIYSLNPMPQIIIMMSLMPIILGLITLSYKEEYRLISEKMSYRKKVENKENKYKPTPHFRIQIKNLLANSSQLSMAFAILIFIALLAVCLIVYGKSNPYLQFMLSIIFLVNSLSVSNLFKRMDVQWDEFSCFIRALPITKIQLLFVNLIITASITLLINLTLLATSSIIGGYSISKLTPELLISILFLFVTYFPQVKLNRYGFFVSFCLMFMFSYVNYLLMAISG